MQIKALEQELALKLFDHKGRKLELTPQDEIFYVEARKVLNSVEEAKKSKNHAADFSGKIPLVAPACLRYFHLPSFARFRAAYPGIN